MSKFFTVMLSVLLLVAVAVPALATDARQQALAGTGNYIEDDYNIFTWYATLPSYSNTIWIGLNYYNYYYDAAVTTSNQVGAQPLANNYAYMGASYGLGKEGKYGTLAMFYTDSSPGLNMFWGNWSGASVFSESADQKWTVMYAYPMEKMSIGLSFNRADWSYKNEDRTSTTEEHYLSYTTFGAGVRFDMGEKDYIDLAADLS
ncbi:MAG TPA: hypothetical protein VMT60_01670, partial [Candidatus Bathyarchaeia archaeon]|nr:hypothetical protein [Candidatus Bathyarchaeia archaeon]